VTTATPGVIAGLLLLLLLLGQGVSFARVLSWGVRHVSRQGQLQVLGTKEDLAFAAMSSTSAATRPSCLRAASCWRFIVTGSNSPPGEFSGFFYPT
jgi:hypothetical protein